MSLAAHYFKRMDDYIQNQGVEFRQEEERWRRYYRLGL